MAPLLGMLVPRQQIDEAIGRCFDKEAGMVERISIFIASALHYSNASPFGCGAFRSPVNPGCGGRAPGSREVLSPGLLHARVHERRTPRSHFMILPRRDRFPMLMRGVQEIEDVRLLVPVLRRRRRKLPDCDAHPRMTPRIDLQLHQPCPKNSRVGIAQDAEPPSGK